MTRDPRVDPQVGDVLRKDGRSRTVTEVREWEPGIYVRWRGPSKVNWRPMTGNVLILKSWREWAAKAEVVAAQPAAQEQK